MRESHDQLDEQHRLAVALDDEHDDDDDDDDPVAAVLAYYRRKLAEYEDTE